MDYLMNEEIKEQDRILIVDDDPIIRELLITVAKNEGYNVFEAFDGVDALEKLESAEFDAVVTDLSMPRMGGMELIKRAKSLCPHVPILAITAYPSLDNGLQAMKEGASDFISKPFKIEELLHCVDKMLNEGRLLKEKVELSEVVQRQHQLKRVNEALYEQIRENALLRTISENINNTNENSSLLNMIVEMISDIVKAEFVAVGVINDGHFCIKKAKGYKSNSQIPIKDSILEKAYLNGHFYIEQAQGQSPFIDVPIKTSLLVMPMLLKGVVFGLCVIMNKTDARDFNSLELNAISTVIYKGCLKLENNYLYESMYDYLTSTLCSLVQIIEARDPYTKNHSERVTQYALEISDAMRLNDKNKNAIRFAGRLHDIGKVGVRDVVLLKPGRLTNEEFEEIKKHVIIGEDILKPLKFLPLESEIVRHHHEYFDGTGYPDGLKGEKIPLLARIMALADTYDALTSTRPYRKKRTHEEAVEEILLFTGKQFDPQIVKAFLATRTGRGYSERD